MEMKIPLKTSTIFEKETSNFESVFCYFGLKSSLLSLLPIFEDFIAVLVWELSLH